MEDRKIETKQELFNELLALKERVFCVCLGFSKNISDAEDLSQEIYLKAIKKMGTLKDRHLLRMWLFRIVKNTCLDFQKKNKRRQRSSLSLQSHHAPIPNPQEILEQDESIKRLKNFISELPQKQREAFILREYGDFTYQEITQILKTKMGTVMSRLNRAKDTLMKQMKEKSNE